MVLDTPSDETAAQWHVDGRRVLTCKCQKRLQGATLKRMCDVLTFITCICGLTKNANHRKNKKGGRARLSKRGSGGQLAQSIELSERKMMST